MTQGAQAVFGGLPAGVGLANPGLHAGDIRPRPEDGFPEPLRGFGAIPGEQARRNHLLQYGIIEQFRVQQVHDAGQYAQRGLVTDVLRADISQMLRHRRGNPGLLLQLVPVPDAMQQQVHVSGDGDALHVQRVRVHGEEQAVFLRRGAQSRQRQRGHDGPVGGIAEAVLQRSLHADRAARGHAGHHGLRCVFRRIRARGQGMFVGIRGLEDVVVEDLVADLLVDEHEWIAIDDGDGAAAVDIRMQRLLAELLDALGSVRGVEYLLDKIGSAANLAEDGGLSRSYRCALGPCRDQRGMGAHDDHSRLQLRSRKLLHREFACLLILNCLKHD